MHATVEPDDNRMSLRYRLLGPVEIRGREAWTDVRPAKTRVVLVILLSHANCVVSSSELREGLWGDDAPPSAAKGIHLYVHYLRRILAENGAQPLLTRASGYQLVLQQDELDVAKFDALRAQGIRLLQDGEPEHAARKLNAALALWRGPALATCIDTPALAIEASRLEEARLSTTEAWIHAELTIGRHYVILPALVSLVHENPYRERFRVQLMTALYRCGRQVEALAVARDLRRRLDSELGLKPGRFVTELQRAILLSDPVLDWPPTRPTPAIKKTERA